MSAEPDRTVVSPVDSGASSEGGRDETAASGMRKPGPPAFDPPTVPGEVGTLGPYRIVKELGKGGMGAVYAAIDTRLNRQQALKVMLPEFAADGDAKERFLREARAAARITHDHVVTVYEAAERNGLPYIAMQLLRGYPLDEYLKRKGAPPVGQSVRIGYETALGLAAAHEAGLIHRDIKPGNLWLEAPNGRIKVLDFGLAKPVATDTNLTRTGAVIGTPAFMSPEQARAVKVDHRTDLFSLGAVLYRLVTGRNPFVGPNPVAVLMALGTEDPPPVRELNPDVPAPLAQLIHQLLAKKPEHRPQTAAEVAEHLDAILQYQPSGPTDPSLSRPIVVYPQQPSGSMHVTAQPVDVFADIDRDDETESEPSATEPPKRNRGVWLVAGVLLAVAAVATVAVLAGKKPNPEPQASIDPPAPTPANRPTIPAPKTDSPKADPPPKANPVPKADPDAEKDYARGANFEFGRGVPQDYAKAVEWYEKAATRGHMSAQYSLGGLYYHGRGVPQDYARAKEYFEAAAAQGSAGAHGYLGLLYASGTVVPQDYAKAREYYAKAFALGDPVAGYNLGGLYHYGRGVEKDYAKAKEWYEKSAALGYAHAQSDLGMLYNNGWGVEKDYAKAKELYEKAAAQGLARAQFGLGHLYDSGHGVGKDYARAKEWYEKAAAQKHDGAQCNLGYLYHYGLGVEKDYAKAVEWYEKAVAQNNQYAQSNLGRMYETGLGVEKDYAKARELYEKAVARGNAFAQYCLGGMYEYGRGVDIDLDRALELYEKSAAQGRADATAAVARLKKDK